MLNLEEQQRLRTLCNDIFRNILEYSEAVPDHRHRAAMHTVAKLYEQFGQHHSDNIKDHLNNLKGAQHDRLSNRVSPDR